MPRFNKPRGFVVFALILAALVALDVTLGIMTFPQSWDPVLSPLTTAVYVTAPIWALYEASRETWTWKRALLLIAIGITIHLLVLLPKPLPRTLLAFAEDRAIAGFAQAGL